MSIQIGQAGVQPTPVPAATAPVPVATPVSVVMPVLNEERYLAESVRRVLEQEYDGELEVVLALGPSVDRTDDIARELAAADPRITLVENPVGHTPAALNAAICARQYSLAPKAPCSSTTVGSPVPVTL